MMIRLIDALNGKYVILCSYYHIIFLYTKQCMTRSVSYKMLQNATLIFCKNFNEKQDVDGFLQQRHICTSSYLQGLKTTFKTITPMLFY